MRMRKLFWILTLVSMFLCGHVVCGQENTAVNPAVPTPIQGFPLNSWTVTAATFNNPSGFDVAAVDGALRAQLQLSEEGGVVVTNILPDSEAAKSGLEKHDVLLRVNDTPVTNP